MATLRRFMGILIDRMFTAQGVAEWLKVSLITVRKWTVQDKIPHLHLSARAVRYPETLIQEWLAGKTHDGKLKTEEKLTKPKKAKSGRQGTFKSDINILIEKAKKEVMG